MKVFASRCPYDDATVGRFMDKEIYDRLDELWIVLSKGHFPEPFDDQATAAETEAKIRSMKQIYRGTPSFNTDPSATSWLAVTRTAEYFKVMDELTKVNPKSPSDNDSYLAAMKHMIEIQMRHLGHALRYHNEQKPIGSDHLAGCDEGCGCFRNQPTEREECSPEPFLMFVGPRHDT